MPVNSSACFQMAGGNYSILSVAPSTMTETDLKRKAEMGSVHAKDPIEKLRYKCLCRGAAGIKDFGRVFRIADTSEDSKLTFEELKRICQVYKLNVTDRELQDAFNAVDKDQSGSISFDEFLLSLRPPMNQNRLKLINLAFQKLDKSGDGVVTTADLKGVYNAKKNPKFLSGEKTEDEIFKQFLANFEIGGHVDGKVTKEESEDSGEDEDCTDAVDGNESDDTLDEILEFDRSNNLNWKMSLSDPELTSVQLKEMFPELSEHWRKALAKSPVVKRAAIMQEQEQRRVSKHRTSRYWLDEQLNPSEHIWLPSSGPGSASSSTDTECYLGEKDCEKIGDKRRCAACHIVAHTACFPLLSKMNLVCKTTFRDSTVKRNPSKDSYDALTKHHWVHRWKLEGRCQQCSKSFQQKMFRDKEVIAITCSWCKASYHNKRGCFSIHRFEEKCDRGLLRDLILPPSWLLRLPNTRKRHAKNAIANGDRKQKQTKRKYRPFVVKPMDTSIVSPAQPLLVFVNPKSGGNKGSKALHTLCWLLNPRQVFDITALKGPKYGLEMFKKVGTQLRILVCGGDGTVGWVLSTLDQLNWPAYPPIAVLPLGTGNDLSRCMGWGGVFSDEPLAEVLGAITYETSVTYLDRWRIEVEPNTSSAYDMANDELNAAVQSSLPLTVMNNYFSIGADAHVALQFHHSRSANPSMLNSRLKNRIAYGGLGTIDLFKRTWKDLSEYITIEADGVDITSKIREFKFHCVLFHNITFYAGGTVPWGNDHCEEYGKPSACDGKIEILGFTTATLAALQMGGKGERIAQCSKIKIVTMKPIPMQVDGEPCLLAPSGITIGFHSKVPMLKRDKKLLSTPATNRKNIKMNEKMTDVHLSTSIFMHVPVIVVGRHDYDMYRDSLDRLKDTGFEIGSIAIETETELAQARLLIQKLLADHSMLPYEPCKDWRFLDYVSNSEEGTFRLSRHQEHNHSVSDICNVDECIILQDDAFPSMTARSAAIGHDLVFAPANQSTPSSPSSSGVSSERSAEPEEVEEEEYDSSVIEVIEDERELAAILPRNLASALTSEDVVKLFGGSDDESPSTDSRKRRKKLFGSLFHCRR